MGDTLPPIHTHTHTRPTHIHITIQYPATHPCTPHPQRTTHSHPSTPTHTVLPTYPQSNTHPSSTTLIHTPPTPTPYLSLTPAPTHTVPHIHPYSTTHPHTHPPTQYYTPCVHVSRTVPVIDNLVPAGDNRQVLVPGSLHLIKHHLPAPWL